MKINIYYGGRGLIDDPTLYVISKMQEIFQELNVKIERYNLFEQKNKIATLPQTLKDADGIILATTVEWYGIGGYMQQFLDACWLYGDKTKISGLYMRPVVMSTTYGEKEASLTLSNAWEILGGIPLSSIVGYVDDVIAFEMNEGFANLIERKAENTYRAISQRLVGLPSSNHAVKKTVLRTKGIELTPQESEQLSKYASDDMYVKKQKEDIQELSSLFKGMMNKKDNNESTEFIEEFKAKYTPETDFQAIYKFVISDKKKPLIVDIGIGGLECYYGNLESADVSAKISKDIMNQILSGRITFQRAFMSGQMTAKGDFKLLRMLDVVFPFGE
ncbi:MAG: SCP2 sterol-binding domain-containing protein [Lachnospiraceae bacterium]|nr:SCP2 sterol-binding domain-containing protein [Lachnospiraceae bacterium]